MSHRTDRARHSLERPNTPDNPDFDVPEEAPEPLPRRGGPARAELLEQLREALRLWSPVLFVRLLTRDGEVPYLHTARGRKDRRIVVNPASGGYCWADTRIEIGHPAEVDQAAKQVARDMGAPIRGV